MEKGCDMKLAHFSDTHYHQKEDKYLFSDILIHTGDFCNINFNVPNFEQENLKITFDQACDFLDWVNAYPAKHKVIISGNHEAFLNDPEYRLKFENLCKEMGIIFKDDMSEIIEIEGIKIAGAGSYPHIANYMPTKHSYYFKEGYYPTHLPDTQIDILLSHVPPLVSGNEYECPELYHWLEERTNDGNHVPLVLCGHIHEARGEYWINGMTKVVNSSCVLSPQIIEIGHGKSKKSSPKERAVSGDVLNDNTKQRVLLGRSIRFYFMTVLTSIVLAVLGNSIHDTIATDSVGDDEKFVESITLRKNARHLFEANGIVPVVYNDLDTREDFYWCHCTENFYLIIETDTEELIKSYKVVSRSHKFEPVLPYVREKLENLSFLESFDQFRPHLLEVTRAISYVELYGNDRSTGYNPLWIGYTNYGVMYGSTKKSIYDSVEPLDPFSEKGEEIIVKKIKKEYLPNYYSYGSFEDANSALIDIHDLYDVGALCPNKKKHYLSRFFYTFFK